VTERKFLAYTGHLNIDVILKVDEINNNITLPVDEVTESFGGTAGNFAMIASKLGIPFRLYSIISLKSHKDYMNKLKSLNVDLSGVKSVNDSFGPICYAVNDGKNQKYFLAEGPMKIEPYEILDEKYKFLHLGTGNPELNEQMVEGSKYDFLSFDPSQEVFFKYNKDRLNYFLDKCHLIMGNRDEINFIFNKANVELKSYASMKHKVIMTDGENGTILYSNGIKKISPYQVINEGGNTLGAGDSFRAGFYLGLKNNLSVEDSVKCGNVASFIVVKHGFKNFNIEPDDLLRMAKEIIEKDIE
jgi:6-phosphofructokinase 1/ribokinase